MVEHSPSLRDQLITVCTAYASATDISMSTLSTQLLNGGGRLQAIAAGGDLNTRSFEEAMTWLADNWPENAVWPKGIARPRKVAA
jgi:hypothetical protein